MIYYLMYLPDELWNIVKEYQFNWKRTHKKNFFKIIYELEYLFFWHVDIDYGAPGLSVHNITGYFHKCYFDKSSEPWNVSMSVRQKYIHDKTIGINPYN
jgi:hypothetical protein